jgi:hypothetical protein
MNPPALTEDSYRCRLGAAPPGGRRPGAGPDRPPAGTGRTVGPPRPPRRARRRRCLAHVTLIPPGAVPVLIIHVARRENGNAVVMVIGGPAADEDVLKTARKAAASARGTHADQM